MQDSIGFGIVDLVGPEWFQNRANELGIPSSLFIEIMERAFIALHYYIAKDFESASQEYEKIIKMYEVNRIDPKVYLDLIYWQAVTFVEQGRWYDGLKKLEAGFEIARQLNHLKPSADFLYQIARTHFLMNNLDTARMHYRDALRLFKKINYQSGVAACKTGLGRLDLQAGYVDDALSQLKEARDLYKSIGEEKEAAGVQEAIQLATWAKEKRIKEKVAV